MFDKKWQYLTGSGDVRAAAADAGICRKALLSHVRSSSDELSHLLTDAKQHSSRDPESTLYQFIEGLFRKHLQSP